MRYNIGNFPVPEKQKHGGDANYLCLVSLSVSMTSITVLLHPPPQQNQNSGGAIESKDADRARIGAGSSAALRGNIAGFSGEYRPQTMLPPGPPGGLASAAVGAGRGPGGLASAVGAGATGEGQGETGKPQRFALPAPQCLPEKRVHFHMKMVDGKVVITDMSKESKAPEPAQPPPNAAARRCLPPPSSAAPSATPSSLPATTTAAGPAVAEEASRLQV